MKRWMLNVLTVFFACVFLVSAVVLGKYLWDSYSQKQREEQLAQMVGLSADALTPENFQRTLDTAGVAMVMHASSADGLVTANIVLEDLVRNQAQHITATQYADLLQNNVAAALENLGATDVETKRGEAEFAGEQCPVTLMHGTIKGVDLFEAQVYIKCGDYMVCITLASYGENHIDQVVAMFQGI
jgi:hypothetical protein